MAWEAAVDGSGKTYYFDRESGETSWDRPPGFGRRESQRHERKPSKRSSKSPKRSKSHRSRSEKDMDSMFSSSNSTASRGSALSELTSGANSAMSKQFFKEHRKCDCCKGYVYGCEGIPCQSLGHCICTTMDTGKALGSTRKYGKFEIIRSPDQLPHPETWPILWLQHFRRCYLGTFMDKKLASHCERKYLGKQLGMKSEDASEAFSLLAWRKSVLYVLLVLSVLIVAMDGYQVYKQTMYWGYLGEMIRAPLYHGISSMPPYNLENDYMDPLAREEYKLPNPESWTTLTGHVRDIETNLCLGVEGNIQNTDSATPGSNIVLKTCTADKDVQWLYGSDLGSYTYARQLKLNKAVAYASVDPYTLAPTPAPSLGATWRSDKKCGYNVDASLGYPSGAMEVTCNPNSADPCCNFQFGICSSLDSYCSCGDQCCNYGTASSCSNPNGERRTEAEDLFPFPSPSPQEEAALDESVINLDEDSSGGSAEEYFHEPDVYVRSLSSREPGITLSILTDPIGICLNVLPNTDSSGVRQVNSDFCSSTLQQGFVTTPEGFLESETFGNCLAVKKNSGYPSVSALPRIFLASCTSNQYTPIRFALPNNDKKKLIEIEPDTKINAGNYSADVSCSFLSQPKSSNWWPIFGNADVHKECIKFSSETTTQLTNNQIVSKVSYKVGGLGFSRFQSYVGLANTDNTTKDLGPVDFIVNLCIKEGDCQTATQVHCEGQTVEYGDNSNNVSRTDITRNFCNFIDCDPSLIQDVVSAVASEDSEKLCLMPYQPMDVVIGDHDIIELVTVTPKCENIQTTVPGADGQSVVIDKVVGCDARQYAAWASPTLANAIRSGEEGLMDYTIRMLWGMHATIFEPAWIIFLGIDVAIMAIDMVCSVLMFWSLWYWAAYKRSRRKLFTAWALTFVGPLLISCIPVRLFIPWDNADNHIQAFLFDLDKRYNLNTAEDMVLNTCRAYVSENTDTAVDGLVASVTSMCAKKEIVPVTCDIKSNAGSAEPEYHKCHNYWKHGGVLQWADNVLFPEVNNAQYADFLYVSPAKQIVEGFPSTCFDIFNAGASFVDSCDAAGSWDVLKPFEYTGDSFGTGTGGQDKLLPCAVDKEVVNDTVKYKCRNSGNNDCELGGFCRLNTGLKGQYTSVACSELYQYMNCTDIQRFYSESCDCTCVQSVDTSDWVHGSSEISASADAPDWYYKNEWCIDGMVETMVPMVNMGYQWVPFKGNVPINTFPTHMDCGKIRGMLFEAKFEQAAIELRHMCTKLLEEFGDDDASFMDKLMQGIEDMLGYAQEMAGITTSMFNAFNMFRIALPVALCIGPALLRGALRTKLLVPQSATPGLFIQLLPWLYCPITWCMFNFIFQLIGNIWLLPGLLLLSWVPMAYFVVGVRQEISKPMTKQTINLVIFWLDIFTGIANVIAIVLLVYGGYYTIFEDPNSRMINLLVTEVIVKQDKPPNWDILIPIITILVFTVLKVIFKYTATTVTGVDFMMYELIQQRFYEMFLEKGDATAAKLQEARANRLDAFCKLVATSTSQQMSRSTTKGQRKSRNSRKSGKSRNSSMYDRGGSDSEYTRESSFASKVDNDTSHLVGPAGLGAVLKKRASTWDMINNGQPRLKKLPINTLNAIWTTPMHLKRSRSKLEILKKMASRSEVAYLSKKLGLSHTNDSAICYELMVWRRSALWTLILVGGIATAFALQAINMDYLAAQAYYDLATSGVLHRFPRPGYLEPYTFRHFGLDDPAIWTIYSGPMKTNVTGHANPELNGEFVVSIGGSALAQSGEMVALVPSKDYDYTKLYQQWSYNPTNNTIKNEEMFCLDVDTDTSTGIISYDSQNKPEYRVVSNGCINDFVRASGVGLLRREQIWYYDEEKQRFRNEAGQCLGHFNPEISKVNEPDPTAEVPAYLCGPGNPLVNGEPSQCPSTQPSKACCYEQTEGVWEWVNDVLQDNAQSCQSCTKCAGNDNCKDYSGGQTDLTTLPLVATPCGNPNVLELDHGMGVRLPNADTSTDRLDSWCNDVTICRYANESKMYALFDYGMNYASGENDVRWRCYAEQTTSTIVSAATGEVFRYYNKAVSGAKYCDKVHESITALMEKAQGREEFSIYMKRMVKVGYARMMAEAESAMISINALLILLAWAAIVLAYLGFHLYSRYKLSRTLVMLGWFCTFLAPFMLSMIPLRLFIRWDKSQPVQDAMMVEFSDNYGLDSKEAVILDTCKTLEEDGSVDSMVSLALDMCAYTKKVETAVAHSWGDKDMVNEADSDKVDYRCTDDLMKCGSQISPLPVGVDGGDFPNAYPYEGYPYCIAGQTGLGAQGGYPAVAKNPCEAIQGGNGQAWIDQGTYVCNNREDCNCPEDEQQPCQAMEEQSGVDMNLDEWNQKCLSEATSIIPDIYYNGYIPLFFLSTSMGETGEEVDVPATFDQQLPWPSSIFVSNVAFDATELLVKCGHVRRYICNGDVYAALATAKGVCSEIRGFLDDDVGTDSENVDVVVEYLMLGIKESSEIGISLVHSIKSFKIMASATFALAPALIRAAIRVKTAVPQNTISGMFVIVLPWLYSPLVWCVYNLVFQVIGNWQLLVGMIIAAYGPVLFFVVGIWKDITRPMPDKEIHIIRLMMTIIGRAKIVLGTLFIGWGLYAYAFGEQIEYTEGYKDHMLKDFSTMAMLELGASMVMKYYYTTVVGVDYMLSQILGSRRYEVYMQMSSQNSMWANSKAAKRAADLKEHYVHLMNSFCHMAGLSTADLPEFANYRAHKLKKKRKEREKSERKLRGVERGEITFFGKLFSRPPDRSEGVPEINMEMTSIAEEDDGNRSQRSESNFSQSNPLGDRSEKRKKKKKKEGGGGSEEKKDRDGDWQEAIDPESGKKYRYNATTRVTEWVDEGESESNIGAALNMSDDELIVMLKKSPKEVKQLHSRDAFRKFFQGFPSGRIEGLLREANTGKEPEEIEKKIAKRLKLLDGVLS